MSLAHISFTVHGIAAPKGSLRAFLSRTTRRVVTTHDNPRTKPWQRQIGLIAAVTRLKRGPLAGPVALEVTFFLPAPKRLAKGTQQHVTKPDLDKLVRCVKDALTGILWADDAQVVEVVAHKHYAAGIFDPFLRDGRPRAELTVRALPVFPVSRKAAQA